MKRYEIINNYIQKRGYKSYLEIGTDKKQNFVFVKCDLKECVDPATHHAGVKYTYNTTSDKAFESIKKANKKYDIIFIDGLHLEHQVDKDIQNSIQALNNGGIIIMHDCNPQTLISASDPRLASYWHGTCYKSFVKLRCTTNNMYMFVIDTDCGCGVIDPFKKQVAYDPNNIPDNIETNIKDRIVGGPIEIHGKKITWDWFMQNKKQLLNLISVTEFKNLEL